MSKNDLIDQVQAVYDWLEAELTNRKPACAACGQCCDFAGYDHRLYLTTPELEYFASRLGPDLRQMTDGRCPYQSDGKCTVYPHRFAGCRIFNCRADEDQQSDLSEQAIEKFKKIADRTGLEYLYLELSAALNLARN